MLIASFDPGITTGFAIVRVTYEHSLVSTEFKTVFSDNLAFPTGVVNALELANIQKVDYVVAEDFIIRQGLVGSKGVPLRVLGAIQAIVDKDMLFIQQPSEKQRAPDELLTQLGLLKEEENFTKHVIDALRHVVIFASKYVVAHNQEVIVAEAKK